MTELFSIAEFQEEVRDLNFEFQFNAASFNGTAYVDEEVMLPAVSLGTIQIELGNLTDAQALDLFSINFLLQSNIRLVASAEKMYFLTRGEPFN